MSTILQNKETNKLTTTEGTLFFQAPEMVEIDETEDDEEEEPRTREFEGKPLDIWATGITVYILYFKRLPFEIECMFDIVEVMDKINEAKYFNN